MDNIDNIARLTAQESVERHIYLETFDGNWAYTAYTDFQVSNIAEN